MSQTFFKHMNIPESCFLNKPIFKKLFSEYGDLDATDKKTLKDDIDKIRWIYTLKPSTLHIEAYRDEEREYPEIAIIQIDLSSNRRSQRIASFINRAIPYPLIILFSFADTIAISVADKRINQVDRAKWVIEDAWMTPWFNPDAPNDSQQMFMQDMAIQNFSFINVYGFYADVKKRVIALNTADRTGTYHLKNDAYTTSRAEVLRELAKLDLEKAELQNKLAKEKQMGRQVEMATKLKKLADQMNGLKEKL